MPRPEKVQAVEDIKARIEASRAAFLTEYRGLTVAQQQDLRRRLRATRSDYVVVKMTLARRAASALGLDGLHRWLSGPTAIAFADDDPIVTARALRDFSIEHERLVLKAGLLAGQIIDPAQVDTLAQLEPREVLLSRVVGSGRAPLSRLMGLLGALLQNAASVFHQLADRRAGEAGPEQDSTPPVPEAAAETESSEAAPASEAAEETNDTPQEE